MTGRDRGAAHSKCNNIVGQCQSNFISVIFHNFSNYDCHLFFEASLDKKKDKVELKNIPKTNEEYVSIRYGCVEFIDSYRFLSSLLDELVETLVDNSHKSLKNFKKSFDNDEILNIVNEIVEDRTVENLKEVYSDKINELEEPVLIYMGENDLKILKTGFPHKWRYLTKKLAYPYEYFNSIEEYQKPVDNLKKRKIFSRLKNKHTSD